MSSTKSLVWWMVPLILGFFMTSIFVQMQVSIPSEIVIVNSEGATETALVVYHSGLSSFQKDVTFAFVGGLVSSDWRCDVTTASPETPTDLSAYDLLVLGTPTYAFKPADAIGQYVGSVGDLRGLPTALLVTGAGSTERSTSLLVDDVVNANGTLIEVLELWQAAPNEEIGGISNPMEIARRAGTSIERP